jgi:hypothetical protein
LRLRVVHTTGDYLVAVMRDDLDLADPASRAHGLAIADNRVGELDLEWDVAMLQRLKADGLDLSPWFTDDEFTELMNTQLSAGGDELENAVIAPAPTDIVRGDLFQLGRHRLLCGDATSATDVRRLLEGATPLLMVTDPPYGVRYDASRRHRAYPGQRTAVGRVLNDDRADWREAFRLFPGAVAYVWHASLHTAIVAASLTEIGFELRSQIIWTKPTFALSRAHYHYQHEPAWYAVRVGTDARSVPFLG